MWQQFLRIQKSRTVRYGVPMLLLVVGGSFGLREFTQIRYDAQKIKKKLDPALEARVNSQKQSEILEEEYKKMKEVDLDGWRNIRGRDRGRTRSSFRISSVIRSGKGSEETHIVREVVPVSAECS